MTDFRIKNQILPVLKGLRTFDYQLPWQEKKPRAIFSLVQRNVWIRIGKGILIWIHYIQCQITTRIIPMLKRSLIIQYVFKTRYHILPNQPLCDYEQNRAYLVSVLETFRSVLLRSRKILSKFGLMKVMLLKIILCTSLT